MTQTFDVELGELRQITTWLAASGIRSIEISRPGATVRLKVAAKEDDRGDDDASVRSHEPIAPRLNATPSSHASEASHDARNATGSHVTAHSVGVFLEAHPASQTPLVDIGARVGPGDVIGLLRIAELCVPVVASLAGVVKERLAAHGATVGYGEPLFEIAPAA
ncbi:acetyl-CoA carboxylase biotin carboxyl carrier protein [Paraburkholderia phosphatilytica]|uniref:acetyl-CoA carboxylase biotin carboxyl carrier protein n=1 Tax=Paraburkholderia phosphatilytica TaxID=2282883 RepID=UPI000E4A2194|nr:hypothetical protein [Paraburkholderia phosphatilytica]